MLCPTRELADQVSKEIRKLARNVHNIKVLTLCGGMPFGPQLASLEHQAHIIVGTPGRVEEHVRKGTLHLNELTTLVLDEADRMLEMGFQEALDAIIEQTPLKRQTLLFSATFPHQIQAVAQRIMHDPVMVQVETTHDSAVIQQHFYVVEDDNGQRLQALRLLLLECNPTSALVFCNTKLDVRAVAEYLSGHGFSVLALHGDLEQRDRDQALVRFSNKSVAIMVATDVAARGLDIDALDAVFNYHIARETEVHVHRIGRTARAGSTGSAYSLHSAKESFKVDRLAKFLEQSLVDEELPPLSVLNRLPMQPAMITLQIDAGKRQKLRPGDILGALTGTEGILGDQVGKINIFANWAYVAVQQDVVKLALQKLIKGTLKGRSFRVRVI